MKMRNNMKIICTIFFILSVLPVFGADKKLTIDGLFAADHVVEIKITIAPEKWNALTRQANAFLDLFNPKRQYGPIKKAFTYFEANVSIDGVLFERVGIRKKGFIGSGDTVRPSLRLKLDHINKKANIEGIEKFTFNNNKADLSQISQTLSYGLFRDAGNAAPRANYAHITVNGKDLGVYTHVERIYKSFAKRSFGSSKGTLYEGTVTDFYENWAGSFERKFGNDEKGRKKIQELIDVLADKSKGLSEISE